MYNKVDPKLDFAAREPDTVKFWKDNNLVKKMIEKNKDGKFYSFYEGPPTANGKPHIGHAYTRTIKDLFLRYNTMKGRNIIRKAGWDTHGLPVELEVEKEIGSNGKKDIEKYGVEPFIEKCKTNVWKYKGMWEDFSDRMGYSIDTDNAYITYSNDYIESEWWSLKTLFDKGLIYKGHRIVPYCPRCATSLSSHEVAQGYRDVKDRTVFAKFAVENRPNTYFLAWTTTPWTLPSNVALCVNAKEDYAEVEQEGTTYIMAKALVNTLFTEGEYTVKSVKKGKEYEYTKYLPLFDYVWGKYKGKAWYVVCDDYVTLTDGTGVVHIAPAFGEDDSKVGKKYDLPFVQLVDEYGKLTAECAQFAGMFVKDADAPIIAQLKEQNKVFKEMDHTHSYPFCWRCDTPLIYFARSSWFVKTTAVQDQLLKNNASVDWRPESIGEGRMGGFLRGLIDWDIGRNRYWGTPIPIWECKCGHRHAIGSIKELKELGHLKENAKVDLHKPYLEKVKLDCPKCGGKMSRIPEVLDCWYDSGSMPFAQLHYPFENQELFKKTFPCEFISEGMDQTRGWFYALLAVNTLMFGKVPYKRCLPLGLINDEHGKKMSKSIGNVVTPWQVFDSSGADAARWYFYISNNPWLGTNFNFTALEDFKRKFMGTLWNTYAFYVLYADIDKFDGSKHNIKDCKLTLMDKWIISKFNSLVKEVDNYLNNYVNCEPARLISDFVDTLSNWYVRRSRERFWVSGETDDKTAAFTTLYYCLEGLSRLCAPFVPNITEQIYQNIVRSVDKTAPVSVHLCDYPVADTSLIDKKLNEGMDRVLDIVVLGRVTRNASNIKNRQPLSKIIVASHNKSKLSTELQNLIKDELNVQKIEWIEDAGEYLNYSLKPQLKTLGPKYGKLLGSIREYLANANGLEVVEKVNKGECVSFDANGTKVELYKDDLLISPVSKPGYESEGDGTNMVILDTSLTPELLDLGLVREFVSKVQQTRKDNGYEVTDHILISVYASDKTNQVLSKYAKDICADTLADSLTITKNAGKTTDLNDEQITLLLKRV